MDPTTLNRLAYIDQRRKIGAHFIEWEYVLLDLVTQHKHYFAFIFALRNNRTNFLFIEEILISKLKIEFKIKIEKALTQRKGVLLEKQEFFSIKIFLFKILIIKENISVSKSLNAIKTRRNIFDFHSRSKTWMFGCKMW